ncbi:MAG: NAD(P)-dependent oxidoreductase [Desulfosporosinus sp.]
MNRAVITGATGMLGIALLKQLIKQNIEVLAVVNPNSPRKSKVPISRLISIEECELSQLPSLAERISSEYDTFYHFAWMGTFGDSRNDVYLQNLNVKYTFDAVQLASMIGCNMFVGAGSQAEYGRVSCKLSPDTSANPDSGYGIAKYAAGKLSAIYAQKLGIKHVWARVLSVYGPHDWGKTMVMSSILKLLSKQRPQYTKAEQIWDYLYCDDAARAFYLIGEKGRNGAVYCLGSGQAQPLSNFITEMRNEIDPFLELGLGELEYSPNQVMYLSADISSLTNDTGFLPRISFKEGIRKTIKWCKEEINSDNKYDEIKGKL